MISGPEIFLVCPGHTAGLRSTNRCSVMFRDGGGVVAVRLVGTASACVSLACSWWILGSTFGGVHSLASTKPERSNTFTLMFNSRQSVMFHQNADAFFFSKHTCLRLVAKELSLNSICLQHWFTKHTVNSFTIYPVSAETSCSSSAVLGGVALPDLQFYLKVSLVLPDSVLTATVSLNCHFFLNDISDCGNFKLEALWNLFIASSAL